MTDSCSISLLFPDSFRYLVPQNQENLEKKTLTFFNFLPNKISSSRIGWVLLIPNSWLQVSGLFRFCHVCVYIMKYLYMGISLEMKFMFLFPSFISIFKLANKISFIMTFWYIYGTVLCSYLLWKPFYPTPTGGLPPLPSYFYVLFVCICVQLI